jgi:murein DD-endopeptidase MepM/ murein hydrolase activator NlpD
MSYLMIRPIDGATITQGFGETNYYAGGYAQCAGKNWHNGVDYSTRGGSGAGNSVYAAANGRVIFAGVDGGWGNTVRIQHDHLGYTTLYAHLHSINCVVGQNVSQGNVIGVEGSTGNSSGTHLHFSVYPLGKNGWCDAVHPANFVNVEAQTEAPPVSENPVTNTLNFANVQRVPQTATAIVDVKQLNIRNTDGSVAGVYDYGDKFVYDSYCDLNGIRWVSYVSFSGERRFVARRDLDNTTIYCKIEGQD